MSHVRGKNTKPELAVRRIVRQLGYRFRAHDPSLPASPDFVFPSARKVILVHGCFWHRHYRCRKATIPKTRRHFWQKKFEQNKSRDRASLKELRRRGGRLWSYGNARRNLRRICVSDFATTWSPNR
ncbi:MAG: very short patch repair endonuclease [Candidatus Acidiferrales bacterium]